MTDIKETKEALIAVATLAKYLIEVSKDGITLQDATAFITKLISDIEFRTIFMNGINGIAVVPAELKNLDVNEIIELVIATANALRPANV